MTKQIEIMNDPNYLPMLDHGFIGIVDTMGSDDAIVQAARVSYGAGTKTVNDNRGLIRYLMRHHHWTPVEMAEVKLHVKAPIFVFRQWQRHRTFSINEQSARYSEMSDEFYVPAAAVIQPQAINNKQGRAGDLSPANATGVQWFMKAAFDVSHQIYQVLLGNRVGPDPNNPDDLIYSPYHQESPMLEDDFVGIARESARSVMPVASYSEMYCKVDLRNLFNFILLRADPHAQYEIRVYADAIVKLCEPLFPLAFEAFTDYMMGALHLSRMENDLLTKLIHSREPACEAFEYLRKSYASDKEFALAQGLSIRELKDFIEKFNLEG